MDISNQWNIYEGEAVLYRQNGKDHYKHISRGSVEELLV